MWAVPGIGRAPHHPVALGVIAAAAGLGPPAAAVAAAHGTVTGPAAAAVRLLGLDPYAVHGLLAGPRRSTGSQRPPRTGSVTPSTRCRPRQRRCSTSEPSYTPPGRCVSLHPEQHLHAAEPFAPAAGPHPHHAGPDGDSEVAHTHPEAGVDPHAPLTAGARALRIGIGGPVGSGKTALVAALCRALGDELRLAVVTNDIYTTEDADFLLRNGVLPADRIRAVETGCCPHTAIRDDISANLDAVEDLEAALGPLDLVLVESGGDNLTATFSRGLIDRQIFVIDVAGGDKVPRKGGPGVTAADLLVINKTDLAPLVGADLSVMDRDARARRGDLPTVFLSLVQDRAATPVAAWIRALVAPRISPAAAP